MRVPTRMCECMSVPKSGCVKLKKETSFVPSCNFGAKIKFLKNGVGQEKKIGRQ